MKLLLTNIVDLQITIHATAVGREVRTAYLGALYASPWRTGQSATADVS